MSATYLKEDRASEAVSAARNAIAVDATNRKGYFIFNNVVRVKPLSLGHLCLARAFSASGDGASIQIAIADAMKASTV